MKKTYLIALSLLFISTCKLQAQVVNNEEDDNEQTEITVTNAQGKEEVIDLPEAMTMELDSLMHLYNTTMLSSSLLTDTVAIFDAR